MPLWKDPRTGKYRYQFQYLGKRYGRNGFDTQKAAKAAMAKHREELENPASPLTTSMLPGSVSDSDQLDLETMMVKHLLRVERDLVPATIAYRKAVFHRFIRQVANLPPVSPRT